MAGRIYSRRELLRTGGAAVTALAASPGAFTQTRKHPNLVFFFTDDQRADALGCAGNPHLRTPNLDALAERGVRFENAFVTLSICSPSRATVLTGRYGTTNGVTTLNRPLRNGERTFAHYLRDAGYQTGFTGKWHLATSPQECGFEFVSMFESNGTYYGRKVVQAGEERTIEGFIDDYVADESIRFIEGAQRKNAPFVLWMCTQTPHMNHEMDWDPRPETLASYNVADMPVPLSWNDDLVGKPPYLKESRSRTQALSYGYDNPDNIRRHTHRYYATITELDAAIGRVIDRIDALGLSEQTWFILMGDNGWMMGEHGFTSKVLAYEPSIRVPIVVAGPGLRPAIDDHLVLNIDLPATMLDLAGVPVPASMHGRSLLPIVRGESVPWRREIYYEAPTPALGSRPLAALRTHRWKYIQTYEPDSPETLAFEELYDLRIDPDELRNVASLPEYAEHLASFRDRIEAQRDALSSGKGNLGTVE